MFDAVGQSSFHLRVSRVLLAAHLLFTVCATSSLAQEKRILLRNETIVTTRLDRQSRRAQGAESPVSGLYLLQLSGPASSDLRDQLAAKGVILLRPVPEHAFVAELRQASLQELGALPFVHWIGLYRPEHKTHSLVQQMAHPADDRPVRVTALLSTAATGLETALLQRSFRVLTRYAKTGVGRVLEGEISSRNLNQLIQSKAVLWLEPAPEMRLFDAVAAEIIGGVGLSQRPLTIDLGFTGSGVTVAVADSGLHLGDGQSMHPDLAGRVDAFFHYGSLLDASDEHSHGTHVTGIIAGDGAAGETDEEDYLYGLGIAPGAHIVAQRIFDGLGGYEAPESFAQLTTDAVRAGADIGSNSWGDDTQGRYDTSAMEFDALVRDADPETIGDQPYILEFSAGNAGPSDRTIGSPAVAKNVIASGASQNNRFDFLIYADGEDYMADFSSRGPCEDGRIKPDVVAPGTWIASLKSYAASDENAWLGISENYMYQGGTSQSGPQVSGAAAVFVQFYRETHNGQTPSPALVKAALINSSTDMDNEIPIGSGGTGYVPNHNEGWGRVNLPALIGSPRGYDFTDQTQLLQTGDVFEKRFYVASDSEPLKITLAYTDVPGFPPAIPALVNDLDLEVIVPNGGVYQGNQFFQGESVANLATSDSINNVEGVHLSVPDPGEYVIRVRARNIVEDSRADTAAVDQDFALVISGDVPLPGQGIVALNRRAYTVPALVEIKLIDFDLAGQATASVLVKSTGDANGFTLNLDASGSVGVFTGAVRTASLPVANDGALHIGHGDTIEVSYQDGSPPATITATARGDLLPPVISDLASTNRFGREAISWRTDERATSTVFYSSNATFTSVTKTLFTQSHDVTLGDLVEGQTYFYYVVSADEAGNITTNNNNGEFFSFVARPAATVLLVDTYAYTPADEREDEEIPVTSYTDALDATGVTYEVWDVDTEGDPQLDDLRPYRIVIWRLNDSFWENQSISLTHQALITAYLDGGGSFLLSSMDVLTRIGAVPFRTNVLQVAGFTARVNSLEECPDCDEDWQVPSIHGAELESLTTGIDLDLDYSIFPSFGFEDIFMFGPDFSDVFVPTTNAVPIFYDPFGKVCGIRYPRIGQEARGRVVFLSFPLDAIPMEGPAPNNRVNLLRNMLSFLAPGVNGLGSIAFDTTSYSAPGRATIEVADSDLIGLDTISVTCRNSSSPDFTTIELRPTITPGLFHGFLILVTNTTGLLPGQLSVDDGDLITAEYLDQSGNGLVRASAEIDLELPAIANIQIEADYENALISWETDEFTDALVQFGESRFLGKTAYDAALETEHSIVLPSLAPDRIYYFQVVSRDTAGNTVVDNNNGEFYSFRTLKPLLTPWIDDLESGATNWSVIDGELTEGTWSLGTPDNFIAEGAFSATNAWGVNLDGFSAGGYVQTFLVSPAVDLTGGNTATLKFWHNYDFLGDSIIEIGTLQLFTNSQTQPIIIAQYGDFTAGWEQEEIDLTPYLGRVVQLVWLYELFHFSDENDQFPGWFLDDVEITVTNISKGTLQITNNLAAASFTASGPSATSGSGRWFANNNAAIGEYSVTWNPVPYYQTPLPQSSLLTNKGTVRFIGRYTIEDANTNGIADSWEREKFGEISPSRDPTTDTDADGLTDLGEFAAGTDPNDPGSKLQMSGAEMLANNLVRLDLPSVPGKTYQILGSTDGQTWVPYSSPLRATADQTSVTVPAPAGSFYFFKLQLQP
jgi:hypothetical protein